MIEQLADFLAFDAVGEGEFRAEALQPRFPTRAECEADARVHTPPFDPQDGVMIVGSYLMGLAVVVAAATLNDPKLVPLSSHTTFLRAGTFGEEVHMAVEFSQDARRFARRRVVFAQQQRTFFTCDLGFHRPDEPDDGWERNPSPLLDVDTLESAPCTFFWPIMEVRPISGPQVHALFDITSPLWFRFPYGLPESPHWSAAALSYAADYFTAQSMMLASGRTFEEFSSRTLEHSMWFHRPIDATAWAQMDYQPLSLADQRYQALGTIHDRDGKLAATMMQTGIMFPNAS